MTSAISDISGHINILDTKVSIVMASLGVIISGIINCRELIYDSYKAIQIYSMLHVLICILFFGFCISIIMVYSWGLKTITTHACNIGFNTLWFIKKEKDEWPFETYMSKVEKMTIKDIVINISAELYKLNDIYRQKELTTRRAVGAFKVALSLLFFVILVCIFVRIK